MGSVGVWAVCTALCLGSVTPLPFLWNLNPFSFAELDNKAWLFAVSGRRKPFQFVNDIGEIEGFNVELIKEVCEVARRKCQMVLSPFTECTFTERNINYPGRGLMAGWFDSCPGYAISVDRRSAFDFTDPYTSTGAHFAVQLGNPDGFDPDSQDYSKFVITHLTGAYTNAACLRRLGKSFSEIIVSANLPEAKELLQNGTAQVIFAPRSQIPGLYVFGQTLRCADGGTGMMVKKGSALPNWWNPAFKTYYASGRFHALCRNEGIKYNMVEDNPEVTEGYFEGDIDLMQTRNAIRFPERKWPNGTVYYNISDVFPATHRATILEAMREIESDTKQGSTYCVRFIERTNQTDYIYIQKLKGCHSEIGRIGGAQELSLGTGCEGKGTIMHELNHALGFWHEQSRHDRDAYVTPHYDNILTKYYSDFYKHSTFELTTLGTPYDFGSLMHYGPYTFAANKSKPSLTPKPGIAKGVRIGQRQCFSVQDVTRIQKLYQCTVDTSHITKPSRIIDCNFETDLCGLTQDTHDNFQWSRKAGATPTSQTGPNADHTNSVGHYIYAEANGHQHQKALLNSSTFAGGHYCLDFWLFQHGSQEGSFQILVAVSRTQKVTFLTVSGDKKNAWQRYHVLINCPVPFHFILQANIGSGNFSDIAVDDLAFYRGGCRL
ncbi:hypothetical protein ACOMHN_054277 [Nucella lapillus]